MFARLGHRLLTGIAVVLGVVILTFLLLHVVPGDPVRLMLGPTATAEQLAAQRRALDLDRPLPSQFASRVARLAGGGCGRRIANGRPLRAVPGAAWPAHRRVPSLP